MASPVENLQHTAARTTAYALVNVIVACLRPEEQMEAAREFYAIVRACLETYDAEKAKLN